MSFWVHCGGQEAIGTKEEHNQEERADKMSVELASGLAPHVALLGAFEPQARLFAVR
jgi:hypothetical protein